MKHMRLVAKVRIAKISTLVLFLLACAIGMRLALTLAADSPTEGFAEASWWVVFAAGALFLVAQEFARRFFLKYRAQRRDAWREHVRRVGVLSEHLQEVMQGLPSGEKYTSKHADVLLATCRGFCGVLLAPSLSSERLVLQSLEESGWVRLTFSDNSYFATVTSQTWAVIDWLCPSDWSPEDDAPSA